MKKLKVKPIEGFDCIAYKRKVQEQIYQETKDMTPEEEMAYIRRKAHEGKMGEIWRKLQRKPVTR